MCIRDRKYITYLCGGKEYPADAELPEEGERELKPIKYDAIKLLTGAYTGKRPYIIVEVKVAEAVILTDENEMCIRDRYVNRFAQHGQEILTGISAQRFGL